MIKANYTVYYITVIYISAHRNETAATNSGFSVQDNNTSHEIETKKTQYRDESLVGQVIRAETEAEAYSITDIA